MRNLRTLALLPIVAILLWFAFVVIPSNKCEQAARMMNVNYSFSPVTGCYIQQPNGNWMQINQQPINNYQP